MLKTSQEDKEFNKWNRVKKRLNKRQKLPKFSEGEIWWYGAGLNLGVEANGKHANFSRPVIVLAKINRYSFLGVPMTSRAYHAGNWYVHVTVKGKEVVANLVQVKIVSAKRLYERMGELGRKDFRRVERGFCKLYCKRWRWLRRLKKKFSPARKGRGGGKSRKIDL